MKRAFIAALAALAFSFSAFADDDELYKNFYVVPDFEYPDLSMYGYSVDQNGNLKEFIFNLKPDSNGRYSADVGQGTQSAYSAYWTAISASICAYNHISEEQSAQTAHTLGYLHDPETGMNFHHMFCDAPCLNLCTLETLKADITNYQQSEEHDRMEKEQTSKSHILVPISPLERKCLEYLTERERKNRRRTDITPPVFFMYVLSEMLIKGNKFSIDCVPDSVIAKFEKELKDE